jgi:uncharacterized NAD(P)/FAD-binding protein YdhS
MHIGIIGGGFSGCLLAVHLLRDAPPGLALTLVESADVFGRGAAYGTDNPDHLLNVRAGNMGAFADDPGHFHAWLTARDGAAAPPASSFVSRMRYGEYIADVFQTALAAQAGKVQVSLVTGLANALTPGERPVVSLADGRQLAFDRLALCFGNLPPAAAPGLSPTARASAQYLNNPWRARDLNAIPPDASVLIVGSGLTMADVVQSLAGQKHKGPIAVLSRHGFLPLRHEAGRPHKMNKPAGPLLEMFRTVRGEAKAAPARGQDWRDVIDALRPWTTELWRSLSLSERAQFLRHIRPHWEVHRHRLAPAIADTLASLRESGQLTVVAARVASIDGGTGRFDVAARRRGTNETLRLAPAWIVNCTGPQGDYARTSNPLVSNAVQAGAARADALQLGLDVTDDGAVIDAHGRPSPSIYAVGPPTRGVFWEITAVPDIRRDCARMAGVLLRGA